MHPLAVRPTYNREQLQQYLDRLHLKSSHKQSLTELESEIQSDPIKAIANLQRKQLSALPWGNLSLHYSPAHLISLDHDAVFTKMVERGLGGYCMEANTLFATVLRSLGYHLCLAGARISCQFSVRGEHPDGFMGYEHMIILVTIGEQKYHVDVGFGAQGPMAPIPLLPGKTVPSVAGFEARLIHEGIAQASDPTQKWWIFQTHKLDSPDWTNGYCFGELEFFPRDFEYINYRTSHDPQSWFTYRLVMTRVILDEKLENPLGTVTITNAHLSRRLGGGSSETLADFKSESERIAALEEWFNVVLRPEEQRAISGMVTEIPVVTM